MRPAVQKMTKCLLNDKGQSKSIKIMGESGNEGETGRSKRQNKRYVSAGNRESEK